MSKSFLSSSSFASRVCAWLVPFIFLFFQSNVNIWVLLFPLPMLLAWWGGAAAGIFTTISSLIVLWFLSPGLMAGAVFALSGVVVSWMIYRLQQNQEEKIEHLKLERSQRFLDSLLENIPNMVFVKDAKDLRFVRFNKAGEDLLGFSRTSMMGKSDYDFFPADQANFFVEKDRRVLAGKEIVDIPEESIKTKDKGVRILHTKKIPIYGDNGEPEYLLGISEDITEIKNSEAELLRITAAEGASREREKNNKMIAFLGEASSLLSSSLDYKQTVEQLTKIAIPALGDWCIISLKTNNHIERFASNHQKKEVKAALDEIMSYYPLTEGVKNPNIAVIESGKPLFFPHLNDEILGSFAQDEPHFSLLKKLNLTSIIIVPIVRRQKNIGSIAFVSSTERVFNTDDLYLAEELGRRAGIAIDNALLYSASQAAINIRNEFLSIASHELKTPLTSLNLQIQMASRALSKEVPDKAKVTRMMNLSVKQIERLTSLINGLLDVSRISTGTLTINPEEVEFGSLIKDIVNRFKDQLAQSKNTLILNLEDNVTGEWDVLRFEQVLVNLLGNVTKYAPGVPVEIELKKEGSLICLSVRDYGPGIPLDKQYSVFERFERIGKDKTIAGLGLGLYIVKQIVNAHQGEIFVDPQVSDGTKIIMKFPLTLGVKS